MSPVWLTRAGGHRKGSYSDKGNWGHIIGETGHEGRMEAQHVQMPTDGSTREARGQESGDSTGQGQVRGFPSSQWPSLSFSLFRMPSMPPIPRYSLFHSPTHCNSCPFTHLINKNVLAPVSLSALLAPCVGPRREGKYFFEECAPSCPLSTACLGSQSVPFLVPQTQPKLHLRWSTKPKKYRSKDGSRAWETWWGLALCLWFSSAALVALVLPPGGRDHSWWQPPCLIP